MAPRGIVFVKFDNCEKYCKYWAKYLMKVSTFIGILIGIASIFGAFIWEGGTVDTLVMLPAMLIVFGGTFAAAMAGSSARHMARLPRLILLSIFPPKYDREEIINQIVIFSLIARREGILSLEKYLDKVKHPYLKKLFEICIDGTDPATLKNIVESEIEYISERHDANIKLFVKMGGYSPTMGIIGTVMGLIATLASAGEDPTVLIHHIASAFIATMWGIFMANIVWLPIGDKLKAMHNDEVQLMSVMMDGAYAVQSGDNPSVVRARLASAFPLSEQERILQKSKEQMERYYAARQKHEDVNPE